MKKSVYLVGLLVGTLSIGVYFYTKKNKYHSTDAAKTPEEKKALETTMNFANASLEKVIEMHNSIAEDLSEAFNNIDVFGSLEDQKKELIAQRFEKVDTRQAQKLLSLFSKGGFFFSTNNALSKVELINLVFNNLSLDEDILDLLSKIPNENVQIEAKHDVFKNISNSPKERQQRIKIFLKKYHELKEKKPSMEEAIEHIKKLLKNPTFTDPLYPQLFLPE